MVVWSGGSKGVVMLEGAVAKIKANMEELILFFVS